MELSESGKKLIAIYNAILLKMESKSLCQI